MSVAVKTSPSSRSGGSQVNPAILSLIGVIYLIACLAIVFRILPDLGWVAWESLGLVRNPLGGTLLFLVDMAVGVGLVYVGLRLLGPTPPAGVRAGVFVGLVGLLVVLLLARWVSLWTEYYAYTLTTLDETTALVVTAVAGVVLLLGWVFLFTRPWTQDKVVKFEGGGWFDVSAYKSNQGQRVRRATIFGILLLVGAGVYTLISHRTLQRGDPDWTISIPYTGSVAVESFGDIRHLPGEKGLADLLQDQSQVRVEVRYKGASDFRVGQVVDFPAYRTAVENVLSADKSLNTVYEKVLPDPAKVSPIDYLYEFNRHVIGAKIDQLLTSKALGALETKVLEARYNQTSWEDLADLMNEFQQQTVRLSAEARKKALGTEFDLPVAVALVDRYVVQRANAAARSEENVKIRVPGDSKFNYGQIVSREDFDAEVNRLRKQGRGAAMPVEATLEPARGTTRFATVTILPAVQFTVPLLLIAGSLWMAWRIVNVPAFADFLIATEAEMNKVSWTTQKKLLQDTVVVLMTLVLMAVFLFGMDYAWKVVLSWKPIGVLYIPPQGSEQNKKVEEKRW